MAIDQRPTIGTAILAGRVPYQKGVYVVGPYAERVSFSSQQRRAMSLVYAINSELKASGDASGLRGKRVCIVGAGLAGLASAVAVAGYDSKVWILETEGGPMASLRNAKHRDIHPSINFWPRETVTLTTALPFFNWYPDQCDNVVSRILKLWQTFESLEGIEGITPRCLVTDIVSRGPEWEVFCDASGKYNQPPVTRFDVIIFAVGFGAEDTIENDDTPSYWDEQSDWMEDIRAGKSDPPFDYFIVSGTGDGGLIEALRLLNLSFRAGSVDKRTEPALRDPVLAERLRKIEEDVRRRISDDVRRDSMDRIFEHRDDSADEISRRDPGGAVEDRQGHFARTALDSARIFVVTLPSAPHYGGNPGRAIGLSSDRRRHRGQGRPQCLQGPRSDRPTAKSL